MTINAKRYIGCGTFLIACLPVFLPAQAAVLDTQKAQVGTVSVAHEEAEITTCVGTLIGANVVLTAAHCVQLDGARDPVLPHKVSFSFTDRDGQEQILEAEDIATHPDFFYETVPTRQQIGRDSALVRLDGYATGPFERVAERNEEHDMLALRPAIKDAPYHAQPCEAVYEPHHVAVLTCARDFGASGSPVFDLIDGEQRIVGIISAKGQKDGTEVSFVSTPGAYIHELTYVVRDRGFSPIDGNGVVKSFAD